MLGPLQPEHLADATALLAVACVHDRAAAVADEKLFGAGPNTAVGQAGTSRAAPAAFGYWAEGKLVGVTAIDGNRIRLLAVHPEFRKRGIGTLLLERCMEHAKADGQERIWALGQAGNYLAPGIEMANRTALSWLRKRMFAPLSEVRTNLIVNLRDNPQVTPARAAALAEASARRGYKLRRATTADMGLLDEVGREFGAAWQFELTRALAWRSRDGVVASGVHIATKDTTLCAFAAHDGNNQGLGWFGPAGTWPAYRGQGLGEALLIACLVDIARDHERCEIAWIGPEPFYAKACGVAGRRQFVAMKQEFAVQS